MKSGLAGLWPRTLGLTVVTKKKERSVTELKGGFLSLAQTLVSFGELTIPGLYPDCCFLNSAVHQNSLEKSC